MKIIHLTIQKNYNIIVSTQQQPIKSLILKDFHGAFLLIEIVG